MLVRPQVIAYEGKPVSWIALADVIGYHFKEKHYTMYWGASLELKGKESLASRITGKCECHCVLLRVTVWSFFIQIFSDSTLAIAAIGSLNECSSLVKVNYGGMEPYGYGSFWNIFCLYCCVVNWLALQLWSLTFKSFLHHLPCDKSESLSRTVALAQEKLRCRGSNSTQLLWLWACDALH